MAENDGLTLHQEPDYYIQEVGRKNKTLWAIRSRNGPDFCAFASRVSAQKALRDLLLHKAQFCECGEWVNYTGGRKVHSCSADYTTE